MYMFAIETTSSEGVKSLRLQGSSPEQASATALTVAARRGWLGASVLTAVRLYRVHQW